jgi:hypothetical protein
MEISELEQLRKSYKEAVERWIASIRAEEDLATPDYSVAAVDVWENAGFAEEEARNKAKEAKKVYEGALRMVDFHF